MKRREALKLMAASVPALATMGCSSLMDKQPSTATAADIKTLNVVFEGPMVMDLDGPQAQIFAPAVAGHQYLIDGKAAAQGTYSIAGIAGAGDVMNTRFDLPRGADAFRLSASQLNLTLNAGKVPFFKFVLPAPDRVVALTSREAQIVDAFGNARSALMPTTYAFVYHVTNARELALSSGLSSGASGWQPQAGASQQGFANLVVAVGLPRDFQDTTGHHVQTAFAEATSYFSGLNMQILSTGAEFSTGEVNGLPDGFRNRNLPQARNERPTRLVPAVVNQSTRGPRLSSVTYTLDCKAGGVIVTTP